MNKSHLEHIGWALLMQGIIILLTGNVLAGAVAGAFFFLGREHAQAEYRYIESHGGLRYSIQGILEFKAFSPSVWNLKSILDWALPIVAVSLTTWLMN